MTFSGYFFLGILYLVIWVCDLCMCVCGALGYMCVYASSCIAYDIVPRLVVEVLGSSMLFILSSCSCYGCFKNNERLVLISFIPWLLLSNSDCSGLGPVSSIEFVGAAHCPCTCIQWKEPFLNSHEPFDVKDLKYNVSVSGADLSVLSVTTGKTNYCLKITPLQEYVITVTPFSTSLGYVGPSHTATDSID